jgi:lipid II:glycine glycyltransferase (peptidoglycan interpeptide bridge formation enzyme)
MSKKGNESLQTIVVSGILCLVCSLLVSVIVVNLRPRQAINKDLDMKKNILAFTNLYQLTMNKLAASQFYYFNDNYFNSLSNLDNAELLGVYDKNTLINASIMLRSNDTIYYHLGATHPDHYSLNGNPFLFDQAAERFQKMGFLHLFLGGGKTAKNDDSLLRFKKKFSNNYKDFIISGMIYNNDQYIELVDSWNNEFPNSTEKRFLQYRA